MTASAYDVFVSYAQKDTAVVSQWVNELRRGGVRVFFEPYDLSQSRRSKQPLAEVIQSARLLLCFISTHTHQAQNVSDEVCLAVHRDPDKHLVPVFLENVRPLGPLALIIANLRHVRAYELDAETLWRTVEGSLHAAGIRWQSPSPGEDLHAASSAGTAEADPPPASPALVEQKELPETPAPRPASPSSAGSRKKRGSAGQGTAQQQTVRALLAHSHSSDRRRFTNIRRSALRARRRWLLAACILMPVLSAAYLWQRSLRLTERVAEKTPPPASAAASPAVPSAPASPPSQTPPQAVVATAPPVPETPPLPPPSASPTVTPAPDPVPLPQPARPTVPPAPVVPPPTEPAMASALAPALGLDSSALSSQPMAVLMPSELASLPLPAPASASLPIPPPPGAPSPSLSSAPMAAQEMKLEPPSPIDLADPMQAEAVRVARAYYAARSGLATGTAAGKPQQEAAYAALLATFEPNVKYGSASAAVPRAQIRKLIEEEQKQGSLQHLEITGDTTAEYQPTEGVWECRTPLALTSQSSGIVRLRAGCLGLIKLRNQKGVLKITTIGEVPGSRKGLPPEFNPAAQEKAAIALAQKAVTAIDSRTKLSPATLAACFAPELRFFDETFTNTEQLHQYLTKVAREYPVREHHLSSPAPAITQTLDGKIDTVTVLLSYKLRTAADQVSPRQPWHISVNVRFDAETGTPKVISQSLIRGD